MKALAVALAAALAVLLALPGAALAATCGNGICEAGETAGNCPADCLCQSNESEDYGLCCCCANDPSPQGQCTIKALCMYPEIGGCCCAEIDPSDPFSCLDCVPNDEIPDWCSGGIGAYESMNGTCGPGVSPTCDDTELSDDYYGGVNARTRCATTSIPLGVVEGGGEGFDLDVSLVYNEGRPPPAELVAGFPNANTGPWGKGGWLSVEKIFTDEGVYWQNTGGKSTGALQGTRGDRNGNGYVGYTLHTAYGSRTYDYPVVLNVYGYKGPVGVYRSEPFDGWFLMVEEPTGSPWKQGRKYTLFRYPNGPFEIYDWSLANLPAAKPWDPTDPVRAASLMTEVRQNFGPPTPGVQFTQSIKIWRDGSLGNAPRFIAGPPFTKLNVAFDFQQQADGGMILRASQLSQKLLSTLSMTMNSGFYPDTFQSPGRQSADVTTFTWDAFRIKVIDLQIQDATVKTIYESKSTFQRAADNLKVAAAVQSNTLSGVPEGDETVRYEGCDVTGAMFSGTTISMPHNVRLMFEYGDDTVQHRLLAQTHPTGARTQYAFNDAQTEPRGELVEAVNVAGPTALADLPKGYGTHVDWQMITQVALDPTLFPADTFTGAPASKGVPVVQQLVRRPDGLVQRAVASFDDTVLLPTQVTDERGMNDFLTYYPDTGQLKSYQRAGVTQSYLRTIEQAWLPTFGGGTALHNLLSIETVLTGAAGSTTSLGKLSWDMINGRFTRQVKYGWQLDPSAPTSGAAVKMTSDRLILRDPADGTPTKVQTRINGTLVAETNVGWDPRLLGPTSASSNLNGASLLTVAPMGGAVDGLGTATGSWQVSGQGEKLAMVAALDPLGNLQSATANGVGGKVDYSAGPDPATLKTSITRLSPQGALPEMDELETAGTTDPVCK